MIIMIIKIIKKGVDIMAASMENQIFTHLKVVNLLLLYIL